MDLHACTPTPPQHTHTGPFQGNPNKNQLPWQLSSQSNTEHFCDQAVPGHAVPGHAVPTIISPVQAPFFPRTPKRSSSHIFFPAPAPILFQSWLPFWTLRSMQMRSVTYPKTERDWAPWGWKQGEVARHLCAFSETEMLIKIWERVIGGAEDYKGGIVRC